ncbi:MAG: RNA polymerase factor sigma-32 [Deltaproteobacteria bacterium]|nr:RNA polymerase factor sigma-32 [Deltaproteobacteria bacterium]
MSTAIAILPSQGIALRNNDIDKYVAEIRKYPLLSRDEELKLALKFRDEGDVQAAHQLVVANLRFVVKIAHEFRGYSLKILDLVQEGNIGLMMAVKKFDPDRGYRLISYAVWWIRAYMRSFVMRTFSSVKLGSTHASRKLFFKLRSTKSQMEKDGEAAPSTQELAAALGVDESDVLDMEMRMSARDYSLDAQPADGRPAFLDRLQSDEADQEERLGDEEVKLENSKTVQTALMKLSEKERYIVEQRFLLEEPRTLSDIGDEFGVSRERVRQLEARAMTKLKAALNPAKKEAEIA